MTTTTIQCTVPETVHAPIQQLLPAGADVDCLLLVRGICEDHLLVISTARPETLIYLVLPDNVRDIKGYAHLWYGQRCHDFQVWHASDTLPLFDAAARWVLAAAVQTMRED